MLGGKREDKELCGDIHTACRYSALCLSSMALLAEAKIAVYFSESSPGAYLRNSQQSHGTLSRDDLTTAATSLLNTGALLNVDEDTSAKVSSIVNASPFQKPEAIAAFIVGGVQGKAEGFPQVVQTLEAAQKEDVLEAVAVLSRASSLEHVSLDLSELSGCGDICLETALQEAIRGLNLDANYTQGSASLRGSLSLRVADPGVAVHFDLQNVADRLFAVELASTWQSVADAVTEQKRRAIQEPESYRKPQLIERVLISPQAVLDAYGQNSPQYKAACCLIHQLVANSLDKLQQAHSNRLVSIIATLDSAEFEGAADLVKMIGWSSRTQRPSRSLLAASNASSDEAYYQRYVAWIVMWGTFFLLLFFAISGCHCLKSMKFKQDSLLYGKNKSE